MMANAATMRILIKGGKVVNDDCTLEADVYIENGIIQQVGRELMIPGGAKVIDATGKLVIPGGIDTSTHFHQTFMNATCVDDFYHGTKGRIGASSGGMSPEPPPAVPVPPRQRWWGGARWTIGPPRPAKRTSLLDAYEKCRSLADPKVCCDYALHMGITWWAPKVKAEMETLVREKGVNSFQMFMTYKDLYMLRDSELYQVLRACRDIGAIARVHAENGELVAEGAKEALDLGITGPEGIEISRPEEVGDGRCHHVTAAVAWDVAGMVQDIHGDATTPPRVTHTTTGATVVCHLCHHRLSLQLEAEATHRVITIANRVSGPAHQGTGPVPWGSLCLSWGAGTPLGAGYMEAAALTSSPQTHCPVYLVNVSSMSAGDVIAAAKMQVHTHVPRTPCALFHTRVPRTPPAPRPPVPHRVSRLAGKVVYAETTTAHATLTGLHYYHQDWFHAAAYVTVPPLRLDTNTSAYLMSLLANDTLNIVASDHRPFSTKQKAMGKEDFTKIPHGVSGVQDRMNIIWERGVVGGKMDENRFVAVTSSNAAKIHNLYPRKGRIIPGADADVVVWDPEATKTISASTQVQGGDINLYENMRCHGVPLVTISRGRVVYENGVFMCAEGTGKFCPLRSFPDIAYKKLVQREKTLKLRGVDRTPYLGDVAVVVHAGKKETGTPLADTPTRPATRHGGMRDLHESSFSLSGSQIDDHVPKRASARILAPPGGRSSGIW
ncbi:hypothetical protein Nmel_001108 [Mimus melanotis]